ncbi:AAA family ATPase [Massilia sp. CCM 8734]|uniref:AAA family ATPase n=1 Tax=Massilia sp. CCM 8734 TaxID=2609283 RepID=UPI00141F7016|nr:AAA family ATPase [Massilia sp. CCM 8734]NHZ98513.1 AAA family ATPase [Massilia sp. CCM 8734]
MNFKIVLRSCWPTTLDPNTVYLEVDNWNDFSFVTMFHMYFNDSAGTKLNVGAVKIGFRGQTEEHSTYATLDPEFPELDQKYFSLGQDVKYYRRMSELAGDISKAILDGMRDIVLHPDLIGDIKEEKVFSKSLLRDTTLSVIKGQYTSALTGSAERTDFIFSFDRPEKEDQGGIALDFSVHVDSTPSTNIHAIIGRNGVGKTTLLNGMIDAVTKRSHEAKFFNQKVTPQSEIGNDYFSSLVSVSFSAFDPFVPPSEQPDPAMGTCYFYIGLKDLQDPERNRTIADLRGDCVEALARCFRNVGKTRRWLQAIEKLGSDENFAAMQLSQLHAAYSGVAAANPGLQSDSSAFLAQYGTDVDKYLFRMSSGHAIVLLTITRLVATVQEKTLVLLDEPESHLHPPLLSAFIRALADLLHDQNGVAIIATHSPVVLQEIPRSCVWKLYRVRAAVSAARPKIETFGENVGILTSEVFSLEVARSGFHSLLEQSVNDGASFDEVINRYNDQLGLEGRAILAVLIAVRDRSAST